MRSENSYNNIYIELSGPRDMYVATRISGPEYAGKYTIYEIEYGADLIDRFEESNALETLTFCDLPESITNDFDFRRRMQERFEKAFIHIETKPNK